MPPPSLQAQGFGTLFHAGSRWAHVSAPTERLCNGTTTASKYGPADHSLVSWRCPLPDRYGRSAPAALLPCSALLRGPAPEDPRRTSGMELVSLPPDAMLSADGPGVRSVRRVCSCSPIPFVATETPRTPMPPADPIRWTCS